jgi:hypothetical protein
VSATAQAIFISVTVAVILGIGKLYREFIELKASIRPVLAWYERTSLDALKIATNPTSERLTELAERYTASVTEGKPMLLSEKQELIDGLREVLNDKRQYADKRQSASLSLRFIEARERMVLSR